MLIDILGSLIGYLLIIIVLLAPIVGIIVVCADSGKKKKPPRPTYRPQQYQYRPPEPQNQNWNYTQQSYNNANQGHTQPKQQEPTTANAKPAADQEKIDYRNAYQAKFLFTKNEWHNYMKLRDIAEVKGYVICPKVRLLDIIEPRKGEKKYKTLFYKVQAKHVDFVICDKNMNIKGIIELDDSSHDREDRKERDQFVDMILRSVGYKVIHTRAITVDILDLI